METKIRKWGNSLAIRIPKHLYTQIGLTEGSRINLSVDDGKLIIEHLTDTPEKIIGDITIENVHDEELIEGPLGNETW